MTSEEIRNIPKILEASLNAIPEPHNAGEEEVKRTLSTVIGIAVAIDLLTEIAAQLADHNKYTRRIHSIPDNF
jgi:hypothetical protein